MIDDPRVHPISVITDMILNLEDGDWSNTLLVIQGKLTNHMLKKVGKDLMLDELLAIVMGRAIWDDYTTATYAVGLESGLTEDLRQVWAFQTVNGQLLTVEAWKELLPDEHTSRYWVAKVYQSEEEFLTENVGYAKPFSDWTPTIDFVIGRLKPKAPLGANRP